MLDATTVLGVSIEAARAHLARFGRDEDIIESPVSTHTVQDAADALGVEPARIAKTLSFRSTEPGRCLLVVTAGDARTDNAAFKRTFGIKASMLKPDEVEPLTGHAIGGVCPFGNPESAVVHLDESLRRFETVFPACGSGNSSIEMTIDDLEKISGAVGWVAVTRLT